MNSGQPTLKLLFLMTMFYPEYINRVIHRFPIRSIPVTPATPRMSWSHLRGPLLIGAVVRGVYGILFLKKSVINHLMFLMFLCVIHKIFNCIFLGIDPFHIEISYLSTNLLLLSFQSCLTLCDPIDGSPPGSPIPGISRQEHWSGLSFPSPVHESEK